MRRLTETERTVVVTLIADIELMIGEVELVLCPGEPAVRELHAVRGWLRGVRDTGCLEAAAPTDGSTS